VPPSDCKEHCTKCCFGSCQTLKNFKCDFDCFAELKGGCDVQCSAPEGALFCNDQYFYASDKAFDFGVGAIGYYRGRDGLHLHFDHLWHPVSIASSPAFEMPLYLGIGARFWDFDDNDFGNGSAIGLRGPIGIAFDLNNTPLDIFFELALVLDFYADYCDHCDDIDVDVNGAIGLRYYLD
jgi:hypothetical protein